MFEDDAEELEQFIASDSEEEAKSTGSEPTNSDSEEEVIVKKRKVTTRKTREENKEDLVKGIIFRLCPAFLWQLHTFTNICSGKFDKTILFVLLTCSLKQTINLDLLIPPVGVSN